MNEPKMRRYQATWAPVGRSRGEFYTGLRPGDRVTVEVREAGDYKSYAVQSLRRPGAWLAVSPEDLMA